MSRPVYSTKNDRAVRTFVKNNIRVDTIIVKSNDFISSTNYNRYKLL